MTRQEGLSSVDLTPLWATLQLLFSMVLGIWFDWNRYPQVIRRYASLSHTPGLARLSFNFRHH